MANATAPASRESGSAPSVNLTEALRRALADLEAAAVGIARCDGRPPKFFTRSAAAAAFFEDICGAGTAALEGLARNAQGVIGANHVRSHPDGPIRGRLIAAPLHDANGAKFGFLVSVRMVEQPKFGARETQTLLALVPQIARIATGQMPVAQSAPSSPAPAKSIPETPPAGPYVALLLPQDHTSTAAPVDLRPAQPAPARLLGWSDFEQRVRAAEQKAKLGGCVLYGDVDQLHVFNKLAGFAAGDQVIAEVGRALEKAALPQGSHACHLSGDRFTVYLPKTTLAQGRRIAEELCDAVSALTVDLHGVPTHLSISFGVSSIPSNEGGLGHALAAAKAACKAAKDRGRGRVEVYQDADQSIVRRNDDVLIADRLRQALEAGRFEIFAQPIVRLDSNSTAPCSHYELLVRMIGESGVRLSPASFMSAATRYQMLVELDRAVLAHVFGKLNAARATLLKRKLRFSVNLTGPTIGDPDFLEWAASRIGTTIPGDWLQFEITETAAVANIAQTQTMIRRLRARGVQFALDDFGTGVSSFAYLKFFDVKMLKLDGAFVRDLLGNPRSESLVRGIAQLGRGMGFETVAECVETQDVRDRLAELGIDCAQGFLFGRPQPLDAVLATL
ncbi:MAG TPA: bifunctional diguanylate cyclase/phosphodiesterase [Steroidobacteraceae bacterium]